MGNQPFLRRHIPSLLLYVSNQFSGSWRIENCAGERWLVFDDSYIGLASNLETKVDTLEIICIGNELLIGKTSNTNATWLAKSVTSLGLPVTRIAVVEDDVDEIAGTIREALARKPKLIITTGGLGPTFDDKTLEGIAKALGRRLEVNANALRMVRTKYEAYLKQRKSEKIRAYSAPRQNGNSAEGRMATA